MIFFWLTGDVAKLVFYIAKKQPIQFIACAATQVIIELGILAQFYLYKDSIEVEDKVSVQIDSEMELDPSLAKEDKEE